MVLFFLAFFTIYLAMHVFTWFRFSSQLLLRGRSAATGYIVCVLLTITPFLAHLMPLSWPRALVYTFWQFTFIWLALIFYLFLFQVLILALQQVLWPFIRNAWFRISPAIACSVALVSLLMVGYGFIEASRPLRIADYELESSKIVQDIKLVFLSDLHLGVQKSSSRLKDIIALIEDQAPDLIIFGGDVVNDHLEWLEDEALQLKKLKSPLGKYGVLGNHEFYAGLNKSLALFRDSEIVILDDETVQLPDLSLNLIGVSDPALFSDPRKHQEEVTRGLLQDLNQDEFNLLVSHRPWGFEEAVRAEVDLHLAGHTHNGQIFPFRYFVRLQFKHIYGLYEKAGTRLIVTSGAGSWGPPIRVMAPAEIVVVDIVSTRNQGVGQTSLIRTLDIF